MGWLQGGGSLNLQIVFFSIQFVNLKELALHSFLQLTSRPCSRRGVMIDRCQALHVTAIHKLAFSCQWRATRVKILILIHIALHTIHIYYPYTTRNIYRQCLEWQSTTWTTYRSKTPITVSRCALLMTLDWINSSMKRLLLKGRFGITLGIWSIFVLGVALRRLRVSWRHAVGYVAYCWTVWNAQEVVLTVLR